MHFHTRFLFSEIPKLISEKIRYKNQLFRTTVKAIIQVQWLSLQNYCHRLN